MFYTCQDFLKTVHFVDMDILREVVGPCLQGNAKKLMELQELVIAM